ncbi:multidrug ABC transporter ATP-binding protein [Rhodococcus sp. NKCM2511]|jgi:ABC-2 type transport system ATP-binding protein|uniref:ABC transporter ATP-binding protein n=1 Tax=Nocardiaceae TaxID=85025 RepID=UPI0009B85002|nr:MULTISPECIES: ABC transporter ATP-binding protein [Rhodococcus]GHP19787.1 multidrug ABC transporter ATP-binding protein [Rhodococcus sp. NKCM2511]
MTPDSAVLRATDLTISVANRTLIRSACFAVAAGECVGLTGPNGSGKSTLLRTVAGRLDGGGGRISYGGMITDAIGGWRHGIGYMPADLDAPGLLTLDEYFQVVAAARGLRSTEWPGRVADLMEALRLTAHRDCALSDLSTGTAKKVGFATAMLHRPPLLLCDEPFEGLDGESANAVTDLVREHLGRGGAALICTHRTRFIAGLAHSVLTVSEGKIHVAEPAVSEGSGADD